jgi:hypothetical protein
MSLIRVLVTSRVTLSHTFYAGETPTDAAGVVTVTVKRLDGTVVTSGAATGMGSGVYDFELAEQPLVDTLTVDWSGLVGGATVVVRDVVEIVGGFLFGLAEARSELRLAASYDTGTLAVKRTSVEVEAEDIAGVAFVPRFKRRLLDGTGTPELCVPDVELRAVRAASYADRAGGVFTALGVAEVAEIAAQPEGVLIRDDRGTWPDGHRNVIVEYEHGLDMPPVTVRDAAILRLRSKLSETRTQIPDRAVSFTVAEGGVYRLTTAGKRSTGYSEVDAAYHRAGFERVWIA